MATIGQIIYNVIDYNNKNGYISTDGSALNNIISSVDTPDYKDRRVKIFGEENDLVAQIKGGPLKKIGVQAPPGTRIKLNRDKDILIGRTGVYELNEEDIFINHAYFIQPYIIDDTGEEKPAEIYNIIFDYIY